MKFRTHAGLRVTLSLLLSIGGAGVALAQVENTPYGTNALSLITGSYNSAFGYNALQNATSITYSTAVGAGALTADTTGNYNTAVGGYALNGTTIGSFNTAVGTGALDYNTTGNNNTATGNFALIYNTTGSDNTASGYYAMAYSATGIRNAAFGSAALESDSAGSYNNAIGYSALASNTTGMYNTGVGTDALLSNTTGNYNSASGDYGLYDNTTGGYNNASGYGALYHNTTGTYNAGMGVYALFSNAVGANNIAIGQLAGYYVTGSNNIEIGNKGTAADSAVIRVGTPGTHSAAYIAGVSGVNVTGGAGVVVNSQGQLGVVSSSRRYKEDIRSMGNVSDRLLALRPVTFRYKKADENGAKPEQYGLIAEEVAEVMPELVVYNQKGEPETVAYQTLAPLLLNELQREHQQLLEVKDQLRDMASLRAEVAELHRMMAQRDTASAAPGGPAE